MSAPDGADQRSPKRVRLNVNALSLPSLMISIRGPNNQCYEDILGQFLKPYSQHSNPAAYDFAKLQQEAQKKFGMSAPVNLLYNDSTLVSDNKSFRRLLARVNTTPSLCHFQDDLYSLKLSTRQDNSPAPPTEHVAKASIGSGPANEAKPKVPLVAPRTAENASKKNELDAVISIASDSDDETPSQADLDAEVDDELECLPSFVQFTPEKWQRCCELFGHDPRKMDRSLESRHHFQGFDLALYPYQLFCVYWMFDNLTHNNMYGGIVADDMGLGKTYEGIGWIVARAMLLTCRKHVMANPNLHLPSHTLEMPQEEGAKCPWPQTFGVQCYCEHHGVSSRILKHLHAGPVVITGPVAVVNVWFKAIDRLLSSGNNLQLQFHVFVSEKGTRDEYRKYPPRIDELQAEILPKEWQTKGAMTGEGSQSAKAIRCQLSPKHNQYKHILLLNTDMIPRLRQKFTLSSTRTPMMAVLALCAGAIFFDEIHLFYGTEKKPSVAIKLMYDTIRNGSYRTQDPPPAAFAFSGTPAERTPKVMLPFLLGIVSKDHQQCRSQPIKLISSVDKLQKWGNALQSKHEMAKDESLEENQAKLDEYHALVMATYAEFMIRRTRDDKFGNVRVCDEPPLSIEERQCAVHPKLLRYIQPLEQRLLEQAKTEYQAQLASWSQRKAGPRPTEETAMEGVLSRVRCPVLRFLRICASFPAAATEIAKEGANSLFQPKCVSSALREIERTHKPREVAHFKRLDVLVTRSEKLVELEKIIQDMLAIRTPHKYDNATIPRNMVLFFSIPANLLMVYLYLVKHWEDKVELVFSPGTMASSIRDKNLESFMEYQGSCQPVPKSKILLTSTQVLGVGADCTRANFAVSFDVPFMDHNIRQAFSRVSRKSQKEKTCSYLLVGTGCKGEVCAKDRMARRQVLNAM